MPSAAPTDPVAFHDEIAVAFHASYRADPNRLERLQVWRRALDAHAGADLPLAYDVGCGSGMLTAELAARADRVVALDGAPSMLALARETLAAKGFDNVEFQLARLPIEAAAGFATAPLVVSSSVIEYLPSLEEALHFLTALVRPGGVLLFSLSNRDSVSRKLVRAVHRLTGRPRYFGLLLHFVNTADVERLLGGAALELLDLQHFGGQDRLNRVLALFLPPRMANNMLLVAARRPS